MTTDERSAEPRKKQRQVEGDQISVSVGAGAANVAAGKQVMQVIGYTAEQVSVLIAKVRTADQPKT